jgi:hypothetical protein
MVSLMLDECEILGHIVERLENRLQWDLIFTGEFFGRERIRAVDCLVDNRCPNSSTLEEQRPVIRSGTWLEMLIVGFSLGRHSFSFPIQSIVRPKRNPRQSIPFLGLGPEVRDTRPLASPKIGLKTETVGRSACDVEI